MKNGLLLASAVLAFTTAGVTGCAPSTSKVGQAITCETDPDTGAIGRCQPSDDDTSGPDQCRDIDEDGDGLPGDDGSVPVGRLTPSEGSDDDGDSDHDEDGDGDCDDDGIPDVEDCDEQPGGDDDESDLPYGFHLSLGQTTRPILDAFASKGASPAEILSVTMDGSDWRLAELQTATEFTITEADCRHEGNRDTGRDRVVVTWRNADGSLATDHMDLRYCE